jgi:hypothetical protein
MERRNFLRTVGCGAAALLSGCVAVPEKKRKKKLVVRQERPNILW